MTRAFHQPIWGSFFTLIGIFPQIVTVNRQEKTRPSPNFVCFFKKILSKELFFNFLSRTRFMAQKALDSLQSQKSNTTRHYNWQALDLRIPSSLFLQRDPRP
jgi:hypothetical protein